MSVNRNLDTLLDKARHLTGLDLHIAGWSSAYESHWRLVVPVEGEKPDFYRSYPMSPDTTKGVLVVVLKSVCDITARMKGADDGGR